MLRAVVGRIPVVGKRIFPPPATKGDKKPKIPRKRPSAEQGGALPGWAWGTLAALAALGVGIWFPVLGHQQRQYTGLAIVLALIGWVAKFGKSSPGLLVSCCVAIYTLFGGPIHMAAQAGSERVIRACADAGMDINARGLLGGTTPLHLAAHKGRFGCTAVLLARGADVNATARGGETALHEAAWEGHADIVALLLDHAADMNALDGFGQTALHRSAWRGMVVIVKLLINAGAQRDIKDFEGVTARDLTPYEEVRGLIQ